MRSKIKGGGSFVQSIGTGLAKKALNTGLNIAAKSPYVMAGKMAAKAAGIDTASIANTLKGKIPGSIPGSIDELSKMATNFGKAMPQSGSGNPLTSGAKSALSMATAMPSAKSSPSGTGTSITPEQTNMLIKAFNEKRDAENNLATAFNKMFNLSAPNGGTSAPSTSGGLNVGAIAQTASGFLEKFGPKGTPEGANATAGAPEGANAVTEPEVQVAGPEAQLAEQVGPEGTNIKGGFKRTYKMLKSKKSRKIKYRKIQSRKSNFKYSSNKKR